MWAILIILGGSIYYTWIKHNESLDPAPPTQQYEQVAMEELEEGIDKEQIKA
jgi:GDP-fucose transporter C1